MAAFRASRALLNESKSYTSPHKYHYVEGRSPFWRKFREIFSANPEISSGLPLPHMHRFPTPGGRKEHGATAPSRASDPAGNMYYNRDFRRKYPALDMITQQHLTKILLAAPNEDGTKTLAAPGDDTSSPTTALTIPSDLSSPSAFTDVLAQVSKKDENAYSTSRLPPTPPFKRPHHILKIQKGAVPHDPHAYYPAENYA
ncbi:hypothetical protein BCV69DRAFT_281282 [Microstroma glucosiphilum]|uniref:21 kDa subunit of NADH dehydrogenase n=1 Tax=Pseudomicrostroma glucosiphilum TaxID=1684307 RepID=A0A316UBP4_9BASI|nr:hypothetical protein BCV69DRAFT_281282 [Pseudomicrostroma glucosiphilum]PWN22278.1 hypothetical protein BCV69DRAFT_281282 [Pseudomicrostroma glucosiphilum]